MTLHHVTSSDEGLYKCNIRGHGESPSSWISVSGKPTDTAPPTSRAIPSAFFVMWHLVVFCPYFLSTLLMVSLYRHRATAASPVLDEQNTAHHVDDLMRVTTDHYF
ncbi:hypothetical protein CRENBAI_019397 [Crenichthys baileyi]|uniref:Uncharacterized protein n=1 Tax=Crenichthys baileyi TaxID=28760 RepID=A0AAV9SAE1_9TELE